MLRNEKTVPKMSLASSEALLPLREEARWAGSHERSYMHSAGDESVG
jgi:hypothetical protein